MEILCLRMTDLTPRAALDVSARHGWKPANEGLRGVVAIGRIGRPLLLSSTLVLSF